METIDTDVLVIGAGPAGLTASAVLAEAGIDAITVTKYASTAPTPRAHITNQRSMEIFRDLGIEDQVRDVAMPADLMGDNVWAESFAGRELARMKAWGNDVRRKSDYEAASPCQMTNIGQHRLEPILLGAALDRGAEIRFSTELVKITQDEQHVFGTVVERETGRQYVIRAEYAIGSDGGRSVVANQLGFEMEGETGLGHAVNVWLEADLTKYREHRPGTLFFTIQPGKDFWLGSGTFVTVEPWKEWVLIVVYDPATETIDLSEEAMLARTRKAIGDPEIDVRIKDISQWQLNHVVAKEYRNGRAFLAGDAAHRHPPANGLGSNTSVQDAYNLAWKLALVVQGKAGQSLLDSYNAERQPVGRQVIDRALESVGLAAKLPAEFGIKAGQSDAEGQAALDTYFSDSDEGRRRRQQVRAVLKENDYQFNAHGVELGQTYRSTAVINGNPAAPETAADPQLYYRSRAVPGSYLPHVWLEQGSKRVSTLDVSGHGQFTLFTGIGGEVWLRAAEKVSSELKVDIAGKQIGLGLDYNDIHGDWAKVSGLADHGCLLIRPDRHTAWRAEESCADPVEALRTAMRQVLGLDSSPQKGK